MLPSDPFADRQCFGYLAGNMEDNFRHHFYESSPSIIHDEVLPIKSICPPTTLVPMSEAFNHSAERSIFIVDQLKIAREIVCAVLKLHSTPWLKKYFNLNDLIFYNNRMGHDLVKSLETLHVASEFTQRCFSEPRQQAAATSLPSPPEVDDALEEARFLYGVRNLTLWSLGTILLQIGTWSVLKSSEDVVEVRKLSTQVSALGPRYRDLTRRCLECDFGYGDDLTRPRLQQAVYEGLVCELSEMISCLEVREE